jgi:hypothetical protein
VTVSGSGYWFKSFYAYRELYRLDSDTDPIGPEPVNSPEAQQTWIAAYSAQLRQDPSALEHLPDSSLLLRRAQYQVETAWAPPYAGRELRQVRALSLAASRLSQRSVPGRISGRGRWGDVMLHRDTDDGAGGEPGGDGGDKRHAGW